MQLDSGNFTKNILSRGQNAMTYKLELITDATELEPLISDAEEQLLILKNEREDKVIQSIRGGKAQDRRNKAIADATARRDSAQILATSLPPGPQKDKQLGIVETQKARLYNLNLPVETNSRQDLVNLEIDKQEHEVLINFRQDVLDKLNARKAELLGG